MLWSILQGTIEVFLSNYTNGSVSLSEVFALLWAPRAQFWFLYALFLIFAISAVIYSIIPRKYSVFVFITSILLYLFSALFFETTSPNIIISIAQNLVFFILGILFSSHANIQWFSTKISVVGTGLIFIVSQWIFHSYLLLTHKDKGFETLLLAFTGILFIVSFSIYFSKKFHRFIAVIGASSMAIYVMHILAGSGVRVILTKLGIYSFSLHLVSGCIVGVLTPIAMLMIINKLRIPYMFSAPISGWFIALCNKMRKI